MQSPRLPNLLLPLLLLLITAFPALAQQRPSAFAEPPKVEVFATLNTDVLLPNSQHVLAVVVDVPEGLHAQSATPSNEAFIPFEITLTSTLPPGITAFPPVYPKGHDQTYPLLGTLNVYEGRVIAFIPISVDATVAPGTTLELAGTLTTQLCDDKSCFPPEDTAFSTRATVAAPGSPTKPANPAFFAGFDWSTFGQSLPPSTRPASAAASPTVFGLSLSRSSYPLAFAVAILVGIIFNVMPCVLPVLPLKAYGFYEASQHSRARSLALGLIFSSGVVAAFGVLGIIVFFLGQQWGALFQLPWFTWSMVAILVLMALGLWNVFTFRLPLGVYSFEPNHNSVSGNFMFGAFTALLSTPCTAPLFPALLLWASAQSKGVGVALMLAVGVGMALPYLLLAGVPELARKFPRTGPWSELIKQFMGFLVLGTAAFLAGQALLPGMQFMYAIAATALVAGIFLVVQTARLMPRPTPITIASILALALISSTSFAAVSLNQKSVEWTPFSDSALAAARAANRPVLVKFTANWCANCHYVEATVFTDRKVLATLKSKDVLLLKVDITRANAPGSDLLRTLNPAGGIPLTAIYPPGATDPIQLTSIYTPGTLLDTLTSLR